MTNLYIVRHCKAVGQAADAPLTDLGTEQSRTLAEFLACKPIDYIVSSPYERAYRTISPLADKLGIPIILDDRLTERVLSANNHPEWRNMLRKTFDELDLCFEGGESSNAAMKRAISVVNDVRNAGYANAVVVSHGNLISLLLKHFDDKVGYKEWEAISNPDVYHLSFKNGVTDIERIWKEES